MSHYYWWTVRDSPGFCSTLHLQKSSSEVAALGIDPLILVQEKWMLMLAFNEPATSVVVALFLFLFYLMNWLKKIVRQCVSAFFCNQSGEWQIALWWFTWTPSTTRWYTRVLKRFPISNAEVSTLVHSKDEETKSAELTGTGSHHLQRN